MSTPQDAARKCTKCTKALGEGDKGTLCSACTGQGSPAIAAGAQKEARSDMTLQVAEGSSSSKQFLDPTSMISPESRPASGLSMQCNPAESSMSDLTDPSISERSKGTNPSSAASSPLVLSRGTSDEKSDEDPLEPAPQTAADAAPPSGQ